MDTSHYPALVPQTRYRGSQEPSAEGSPAAVHLSHKAGGKEDVASRLSTQRATATRELRAEAKLVTGAQLSEAGS